MKTPRATNVWIAIFLYMGSVYPHTSNLEKVDPRRSGDLCERTGPQIGGYKGVKPCSGWPIPRIANQTRLHSGIGPGQADQRVIESEPRSTASAPAAIAAIVGSFHKKAGSPTTGAAPRSEVG